MKKAKTPLKNSAKRLITAPFYPLPTLALPIYAAVTFGLSVFAIIRRNTPLGVAATFLIIVPVISALYMFICFCGISAELRFDRSYVRKGEKARAVLSVTNYFPFPLFRLGAALYLPKKGKDGYICSRTQVKSRTGVTMGGLKIVTAEKEMLFGLAGSASAKSTNISVYDPLGLFRLVSKAELEATLAVVPVTGREVEAVKVSTGMGEGSDRTKRGDDRDEVFEIADYVPGDSLKDIHWKKSAREEELQIIKFASPKEKCYCVLCDCGDYYFDQKDENKNAHTLDAVLETAFGLCKNLCTDGSSVTLAWRTGKEDIGVSATLDEGFIYLCQSGYVTQSGVSRIDPAFLAGCDGVNLVTGALNTDTAAQVIAIQTETPNVKGIVVTVCADPETWDATVVKSLESSGVVVTYAGEGGKK